jgi:L,D-transpeptidase ErfK/SrfK
LRTRSVLLLSLLCAAFPAAAYQTPFEREGLPPEAPRSGKIITIDVSTNTAYLFEDGELRAKSPVATGSDTILRKGSRLWLFRTPRGRHEVLGKIVDPVWHKPDWAFIEEGKPLPPADSPQRRVRGKLGKYALDLGGGILIHGTDEKKSIGRRVSHGCIRMPDDMLRIVWREASLGTEVYIFDSQPATGSAWRKLLDAERDAVR